MSLGSVFKGWKGELKTKIAGGLFLGGQYRVFNNVVINSRFGETQIDHIIVSAFGVFVIETKDRTGWIFGGEKQARWTQIVRGGERFSFQNPLRQNYLHTRSLSECLGIDHRKIHSLVVFWGDCQFKTRMPENVIIGGVLGLNLRDYVKSKTTPILSIEEVSKICEAIRCVQNGLVPLNATYVIREKAATNACPKCGAALVKRTTAKGKGYGQLFWGCSNYPRCHYTKSL